ncbi:BCCT family transporter [uncultured Alcanivorax sp.]|uniref:BCCT family transporter n=1 Tax=uncultured Alcanivorax sp. TaxID=191215 RepID=UPI0026269A3F|nr:BCCT family transporter [uncultured Alcanivorax sp.]
MAKNAVLRNSTILVPVFVPAVIVALLLIIGTISDPKLAGEAFSAAQSWITVNFGWFYMLVVALFFIFIVGISLTSWGNIKLGPDHCEAEYSFPEWFAMLFSAGYGIALLFFGVAEPVLHYAEPPVGAAQTVDAAKQAMQIAFFHWGFHIWAIYGLVGLVMAYFAFRHGLPLSMRSAFYPLIGEKIYGPIGHAIDVFAILGTMFGIATTLGLSAAQINAGLNYLWDVPVGNMVQISAIAIVTALATVSVVAGMDKGVRRLSILNMVLAVTLMLFVFVVGPTVHILESFVQNTGSYLSNIVERTFNLQAYTHSDWIGNWTLFIFSWTIAWAPFVGLFIAKISRGRTIRQFVVGVMLVPSIFTFLWFSVFGDTALNAIMEQGYTELVTQVQADKAVALFQLFDHLPWSTLVSFLAVCLIVTFFVTSSDSGSLVVDSLASGGVLETPAWQRIFWAVLEGAIASVLLLAGGLSALQTMTMVSALPFAIIILLAAVGMWRALVIEGHRETSLQAHMAHSRHMTGSQWRHRLTAMIRYPTREEVESFIRETAMSSMNKVVEELRKAGWDAAVDFDEQFIRAELVVNRDEHVGFIYDIRLITTPVPEYAYSSREAKVSDAHEYCRAEVFLRRGGRSYDVFGYDEVDIIRDMLDQFENYLHFLNVAPGKLPWEMAEHDDLLRDQPGDDSEGNDGEGDGSVKPV